MQVILVCRFREEDLGIGYNRLYHNFDTDFFVTTNLWVRYYTNKTLLYGSIAGAMAIISLAVAIVVFKKKKNEK